MTPAALVGYFTATLLSFAVDDIQYFSTAKVAALFLLSAAGANVCYTFAYALEFWFGSGNPESRWFRRGRTYAFVAGTLLGVVLAFAGGRNIGNMQFQYPGL
jgi:hypothetical protein